MTTVRDKPGSLVSNYSPGTDGSHVQDLLVRGLESIALNKW